MTQAKGSLSQVIIQEETTYKTDPAAPDCQKVYFETCGIRRTRPLESSAIIQSNRSAAKPGRGLVDVAGPISTEMQAYMGLLLKAVLGSVTTVDNLDGTYTHTIKVGASLPSLLIETGFTDIGKYQKFNGCKAARMSFSVAPNGTQKITYDFVGATETPGVASFDSTPTDLGKQSFDGYALAQIQEGGVALASVVGIDSLSFDNGLDLDGYNVGDSGERSVLDEGLTKVTGKLKARFVDTTLLDKAIGHTESSLQINYALGDGLGSAGNEGLEFKIPELVYAIASPIISGPKGILVDLDFEGYYTDSSEASTMQVIIKNTQATL